MEGEEEGKKKCREKCKRKRNKTEKEEEISRGEELVCSLGKGVRQGSSVGIVTSVP